MIQLKILTEVKLQFLWANTHSYRDIKFKLQWSSPILTVLEITGYSDHNLIAVMMFLQVVFAFHTIFV